MEKIKGNMQRTVAIIFTNESRPKSIRIGTKFDLETGQPRENAWEKSSFLSAARGKGKKVKTTAMIAIIIIAKMPAQIMAITKIPGDSRTAPMPPAKIPMIRVRGIAPMNIATQTTTICTMLIKSNQPKLRANP